MPVSVSGIGNATQIAAGENQTCALLTGGGVNCWGWNNSGDLGDGTYSGPETCNTYPCSTTPVAVSGISNATQVAAGGAHTCALLKGGSIECWGNNTAGELGTGTTNSSDVPVSVSGIGNATQVAAGSAHTCALLKGGNIECWGYNGKGQLGDGTTNSSDVPVSVSGISNATQIAAGAEHTCARLASGSIDCWGYNKSGQLGDGTVSGPDNCGSEPCSTTPVAVSGISHATQIAAGTWDTCALLAGGSADCWGYNGYGQLGDATTTSSAVPVAVSGIG